MSNKLELGQLITDEVTISLFRFYFSTLVSDKKSMLLDGYPRTLAQLVDLVQTCLHSQREVVGIYFELSREEAKKECYEEVVQMIHQNQLIRDLIFSSKKHYPILNYLKNFSPLFVSMHLQVSKKFMNKSKIFLCRQNFLTNIIR